MRRFLFLPLRALLFPMKESPLDFSTLERGALAFAFGLEEASFEKLLSTSRDCYEKIELKPRRGTAPRIVYRVESELKAIQQLIGKSLALTGYYPTHDQQIVHGFVKGKSITTNAELHCKKRFVRCCDIENFFGSITSSLVNSIFVRVGCSASVAAALTELCTLHGSLVQGAPSSPTISNLAACDVDVALAKLANDYGCTFTRYVDDVTFSGDRVPSRSEIEGAMPGDFRLCSAKWRDFKAGHKQYVTGVAVDGEKPRANAALRRQVRAELRSLKRLGSSIHFEKSRISKATLLGKICHINSIEKELGARLFEIYNSCFDE